MSEINIRDARASDREQILAVTLAAYQEYATQMPPQGWQMYRDNIVNTLAAVAPAEQIVAELEKAIVGTVLLFPGHQTVHAPGGNALILEYPEVRLLAVAPSARGHGAGKKLMQECIRRAREHQSRALTLHTSNMMQTAMQMYERMGFKHTPATDFHPAPGITIKGYRLDLDP